MRTLAPAEGAVLASGPPLSYHNPSHLRPGPAHPAETGRLGVPPDCLARPVRPAGWNHAPARHLVAPAPAVLPRRRRRAEPHAVGSPARREGLLRHGAAPARSPRDALHRQPRSQPAAPAV